MTTRMRFLPLALCATLSLCNSSRAATYNIPTGTTTNLSSTLSVADGLTKTGGGTLIVSGASNNTYTGWTSIDSGVLVAAKSGALGRITEGTIVASGASLFLSNNISIAAESLFLSGTGVGGSGALGNRGGTNRYQGPVSLLDASQISSTTGTLALGTTVNAAGFALTFSNADAASIIAAGSIDGIGSTLTKLGAGTLVLQADNNYDGATTITGGAIRIADGGSLGATGAGTTVARGAALELSNSIIVGTEALSLSGTGVGGAGTLRNISGDNTYQGTITNILAARINSDAGTLTLSGAINSGTQNLTFGGAGNIVVSGSITSTLRLTKDGAGTATLMASNAALSNLIIIDTGTLEVASGFAISDAGRVVFSSSRSGTLLVSKSETIGGLSGGSDSNGIVSIASEQTLTLAASGGSQTFAGRISGPGSLVKTNGGIQALTGANTFAGGTLVKAGALIVNGMNSTGSGVLTVSAGATLGGFGSVSGATSIAGIHSPGASPGVQTFLSDLTYEDLASVSWELISNTSEASARGTDYDGVNVDGNLTFNGNVALDLSFNSAGSSVDWNDAFWSVSQNWMLYQVALSTTGPINLQLNPADWLDANGNGFNAVRGDSGSTFSVSKSGENIVLSYNVVPEPSTYALLLMTGAGVLWWARRIR